MTISSGSHSRRSSRTPRSAAEPLRPRRFPRRRGLGLILALLAIAVPVLALVAGGAVVDDSAEQAGEPAREFRGPLDLEREKLLGYVKQGFRGRTDFTRRSVPLPEFVPAGPPRNGIPSIDDPAFVSVEEAGRFLDAREPVAVVELAGEVRAYPIQILIWHEIVNDEIAGEPVAVTYCPLCNSTVAFRREIGGRELSFGSTGVIRNSDLVMYDRQTFTWWQQLTGEAVVGRLTGRRLDPIASQLLAWRRARRAFPQLRVLARPTDAVRPYGRTPYIGYERGNDPYLFRGTPASGVPAIERVAAVPLRGGRAVVYPFSRLRDEAPINDTIRGRAVVVFFDPGVRSALEAARIGASAEVGASSVFAASLNGQRLTFDRGIRPGRYRDRETRSAWDSAGQAVAGPLAGARLRPLRYDDQFWFALAAFYPNAEIRR